MADENKTIDTEHEYLDDGTKNPDFKTPDSGKDESANADTKKEGVDDKGEKKEDGEIEFDDTIDPTKPPEIPIRESIAQHIIARKNEKIKKLESKMREDVEEDDSTSDNEEDNLTEEAKNAIDTKVQKAMAPLLGKLASEADEKELQTLITEDPEAKKYVNHIKAYMGHDTYKGVSPVVIYHHLAWTAAQALGAKRKQAADLEAKQNKSGGRSIVDTKTVGELPTAEDISSMSDADFEKMENDARQGKFVK